MFVIQRDLLNGLFRVKVQLYISTNCEMLHRELDDFQDVDGDNFS